MPKCLLNMDGSFTFFFFQSLNDVEDNICTLCLSSVHFIREVLKDNFTRVCVKDSLEDICSFLPPMFFSKCFSYVAEAEPIYYEQLIKDLDPNSTCKLLSLCKSERRMKKVVQANKVHLLTKKLINLCVTTHYLSEY